MTFHEIIENEKKTFDKRWNERWQSYLDRLADEVGLSRKRMRKLAAYQYQSPGKDVRQRLAAHFGIPEEELFPHINTHYNNGTPRTTPKGRGGAARPPHRAGE